MKIKYYFQIFIIINIFINIILKATLNSRKVVSQPTKV